MTWSNTPIIGTQSVSANKTPLNNAFTYIADTMKVDHYWDNANSNLDGHHQYVQMDNQSSDPALDTDMTIAWYGKSQTIASVQRTVPFVRMKNVTAASSDIVPVAVLWAWVNFDGRSSNGSCTLNASSNVASVSRTAQGLYTITFTSNVPHNKYAVTGIAMADSSSATRSVQIAGNATYGNSVAQGSVKIQIQNSSGSNRDPLNCMVTILGH